MEDMRDLEVKAVLELDFTKEITKRLFQSKRLNNNFVLGCSSGLLPWGGNFAKTQKLAVKFSFLHVYSVGFIPTHLLNSRDYSHLHVYLVSKFIQ